MICVKIGLSLKKCGLREILSCSTTQKLICNAITWSKLDQVVVDSKHVNWWKITQRLVIYHHISSLVVHDNCDGYNNIKALIFLVGSFCKMYLKICKEYFVVNPCFIGGKIAKKKGEIWLLKICCHFSTTPKNCHYFVVVWRKLWIFF